MSWHHLGALVLLPLTVAGGCTVRLLDETYKRDAGAALSGERDGATCTMCGSRCVDTTIDPAHCGGCERACAGESACIAGACETGSELGESCASPHPLAPEGGAVTFTFPGLTADHTPLGCGPSQARPDYVIAWTPSVSTSVTVTAAGESATVDTVLAVFRDASCDTTTRIGCNDDHEGAVSSRLTFEALGETTYYIVVAPYSSTTPTAAVRVTVNPT